MFKGMEAKGLADAYALLLSPIYFAMASELLPIEAAKSGWLLITIAAGPSASR